MNTNDRAAEITVLLSKLADLMADPHANEPPPPPRQMPERVLLTVEEAAEQLGIGRSMAFRLIRNGELESVQIGRLRRVPISAIKDYAARLVTQQARKNAA